MKKLILVIFIIFIFLILFFIVCKSFVFNSISTKDYNYSNTNAYDQIKFNNQEAEKKKSNIISDENILKEMEIENNQMQKILQNLEN